METQKWVIDIEGYGMFFYHGTESMAEEMRSHKSSWEGGLGRKRLADQEEIKTGVLNRSKNHPNYIGQNHV